MNWVPITNWYCAFADKHGKPLVVYTLGANDGQYHVSAVRYADTAHCHLGAFHDQEKAEKAVSEHVEKYFPGAVALEHPLLPGVTT